jgi:hypothetical protein
MSQQARLHLGGRLRRRRTVSGPLPARRRRRPVSAPRPGGPVSVPRRSRPVRRGPDWWRLRLCAAPRLLGKRRHLRSSALQDAGPRDDARLTPPPGGCAGRAKKRRVGREGAVGAKYLYTVRRSEVTWTSAKLKLLAQTTWPATGGKLSSRSGPRSAEKEKLEMVERCWSLPASPGRYRNPKIMRREFAQPHLRSYSAGKGEVAAISSGRGKVS